MLMGLATMSQQLTGEVKAVCPGGNEIGGAQKPTFKYLEKHSVQFYWVPPRIALGWGGLRKRVLFRVKLTPPLTCQCLPAQCNREIVSSLTTKASI